MRNETREKFNNYVSKLATLNLTTPSLSASNGVLLNTQVQPSVVQRMVVTMQESVAFLGNINILLVDELAGEKVQLEITQPIASRTDTSQGERSAEDPTALQDRRYECQQTNFDSALPYSKIDAWAKSNDFHIRIRDAIIQRRGLDMIMIGWNGTNAAPTTDRETYPLLQDVNVGWLQHVRNDAPQQVMDEGELGAGKITVGGADSHYQNLDALAWDLRSLFPDHIDPLYDLVALCSRSLLSSKYFGIVNQGGGNVEALAADKLLALPKTLGGLRAFSVPYLPDDTLVITPFSNLSIYVQEAGIRRRVMDNPRRDQVENYESSNEAYVVEDYDLIVFAEHIELEEIA